MTHTSAADGTMIVCGDSVLSALDDSSTAHTDLGSSECSKIVPSASGRIFDEGALAELRGEKLDQIRAGQLDQFDEQEEDQYEEELRVTPRKGKRGSVFNKDFLSKVKY